MTNTINCTEVNLATGDGYEYSESFSLLLTATSDFIVDVVQNMTEVTILNSDGELITSFQRSSSLHMQI